MAESRPAACERDYNVKWDGVTLTLRNAYITGGYETTPDFTKGIYFKGSLDLVLIGTNTVTRTDEAQLTITSPAFRRKRFEHHRQR